MSLLNEAVESSKSVRVLAAADRFLLEMSQIPRYEERIKCLNIIRTFRERIEDVKLPILGKLIFDYPNSAASIIIV